MAYTGMEELDITFVDHLEELRWKLIRVLIFFFAAFLLVFVFSSKIVFFLQEPIKELSIDLHYFRPYDKFLAYLRISFYTGLILTIPFAITQIAIFVYPALEKNERKYMFLFSFIIPVLFCAGAYFSYRVIAPTAFRFFLNFASGDNVIPIWGFAEYYNLLFMLVFALGLLFQTPIILLVLIRTGILEVETLVRYRVHIIIIIGILAALVSPPDVISQIMLGIPLYLLVEATILIGRFVQRKK